MLLVDSATTVPLGPAGPFKVTVPVEELPPITDEGLAISDASAAGLIVSFAVSIKPADVADIVATDWEFTPAVVTLNDADCCPADTVTVPGVEAEARLLDRLTTVPAGPAGPLKVTVPDEELPPVTTVGVSASEESTAGTMVRAPFTDWPLAVAVMVAVVNKLTPVVDISKLPFVFPAGITNEVGTLATAELLASDTVRPVGPAGPFRVTEAADVAPPVTVDGLTLIERGAAVFIVSVAVWLTPGSAVIPARIWLETGDVTAVKFAVV